MDKNINTNIRNSNRVVYLRCYIFFLETFANITFMFHTSNVGTSVRNLSLPVT